ncbi:nicotinate-nucleotide--dimethylbenzimidazole phosphoribosyltransferase [Pseudomonas sp. RL_15y_Pfl2_60]|uniref:nicotinate-nucleotide--dimethylbenzimidazole phosphoribosyltransferase n=1 Tax=Pseudomonas sp. RL_15y_Pfl2_60 TaxID=3088709 RepID=UPI0030D783CB
MSKSWLQQACRPLDVDAQQAAQERQAQLTKPAGSLAQLELIAVRLAGLQGREKPRVEKIWISIFAADHGIASEGVSAYPQEVTGQMLGNFVGGGAAINVLARQLDAQLEVIDLGTATALDALPGVRHLALGPGTQNFLHGPAMTAEHVTQALAAGRDAVLRAQAAGTELFIAGEMGIANTTSASALACWLLQCDASALVGPGTGLNAAGVQHKTQVIDTALALHRPQINDVVDGLRRLGGFEIAALAGAYLACAQQGIAALVDGFICTVAALVAQQLNAECGRWLFFAHRGAEPGHGKVLHALDGQPLLDIGLRLGEGSGAALAAPLLRMACALHNDMATFAEAAVSGRSA